ncbi:hypothetical protein OLMES_1418 [Oleiphilus messinensis]|uniref:Oxidoreductase n=1 Tax=Oleiphilus messinensis TaxID=141451 RepID=A0A1Y0I7L4_9GAMM|nr:DUF934 domain-containing protein [Oleiphilus messinensis]ARU55495.1 hypothetical protein OLMES_1418 [Oleiphilus messinensis]
MVVISKTGQVYSDLRPLIRLAENCHFSKTLDPGILLTLDTPLSWLTGAMLAQPLLVVEVVDCSDGRLFSLAPVLRDQMSFRGELRATGSLLPDQFPSLIRCGFDSFQVPDESDVDYALQVMQHAPDPGRYQQRYREQDSLRYRGGLA